MRTRTFAVIATIALAIASLNVNAQRGIRENRPFEGNQPQFEKGMQHRIPNLTPDQETKLNDLRTKHLKEITPLRNELQEKRARLNTLQSSEKPDLAAINKLIDEMGTLKTNLMKKQAAHRNEVSQILTDEQRVHFNARQGKKGKQNRKNMGY